MTDVERVAGRRDMEAYYNLGATAYFLALRAQESGDPWVGSPREPGV